MKSMVVVCSIPWLYIVKNCHVHEGGKVRRSNAIPTNFFPVDFYDQKPLSFKFGNNTFITFKMPRSSFLMSIWKINISLLFCSFASEVLALSHNAQWVQTANFSSRFYISMPHIKI